MPDNWKTAEAAILKRAEALGHELGNFHLDPPDTFPTPDQWRMAACRKCGLSASYFVSSYANPAGPARGEALNKPCSSSS
jgi:hypothetical protein